MVSPILARRGPVATYLHRPEHRPRRPRRGRPAHQLPVAIRPYSETSARDLFESWLVRVVVLVAALVLLRFALALDVAHATALAGAAAAFGGRPVAAIHPDPHPLAGKTVTLRLADTDPDFADGDQFRVEDWWDRVSGGSWMFAAGNPAALKYAMRAGVGGPPIDDEVVYGKDQRGLGHIVHISELVAPEVQA